MRLIDANEITKNEHQHYDYIADEYYVFVRDIENAPTIEAEPVRHGHWTTQRTSEHDGEWYCSNCGYEPVVFENEHYCQHCGARMDEVEE